MPRTKLVACLTLALGLLGASGVPGEAQAPPIAPSSPMTPGPGVPASAIAGRTISLEDAIRIALETQPQIQARLFDYGAARFRVDQAFAPLLPQLTGTVSVSRSNTIALSTTGGGTAAIPIRRGLDDTFLAQVALSQLLFDFGKTAASVDVARKLAEVSRQDVELQRQLIALAVKEAYTNILFGQRLVGVQRQALERAELNLRSARGFFDVGARPKSDVARAEVDVANARLDSIRAANAERLARVALNTAMGLPANVKFDPVDNLVYQKAGIPGGDLMAEALRQRPEYRQSQLRVEGADAALRRTFRDFFPDVVGTGTYAGVRTDLNESWTLGLSLNWPLFDGGNRIARYREAQANLDASHARLRALALEIGREVEQAFLVVTETEERIQAAQTAVVSAQENFRLAQGRFDAGVGTIIELTDAQLALTQAQNTEAQALADHRISLARLERALGRR